MSQQAVELIRAYYERWNARDLAPAFELLAPDVEWHTAPSSLSAGKTLHGKPPGWRGSARCDRARDGVAAGVR